MNTEPEKYIDLRGLAEYSSLAVPTIRDYLKALNPIPHYKLKGKILVRKSEFDLWIKNFQVKESRLDKIVDDVLKSLK